MEGIPCPIHGTAMDWLGTTNQWEYYCARCDARWNQDKEPRPEDARKLWLAYPDFRDLLPYPQP